MSIRLILSIAFVTLAMSAACRNAHAQWVVGHRGASAGAPENTLAAFRLAWQQGADAVEGDFYLSADGQIVCIHDADTERTTGVHRVVKETPFSELRQLDAGSWKAARFARERIPSFGEVLDAIPADKHFVIELKTGPEIVPVLVEQLAARNADLDQLLIIAFNADTIAACKQALPAVEAHWLTGFKQAEEGGAWTPTARQIAETVRRCGADGVGMNGKREVIDRGFIAELRDGGCERFHVWTINDVATARYFQQLGAAAITTDYPGRIAAALTPSAVD